MIFTNGHLM